MSHSLAAFSDLATSSSLSSSSTSNTESTSVSSTSSSATPQATHFFSSSSLSSSSLTSYEHKCGKNKDEEEFRKKLEKAWANKLNQPMDFSESVGGPIDKAFERLQSAIKEAGDNPTTDQITKLSSTYQVNERALTNYLAAIRSFKEGNGHQASEKDRASFISKIASEMAGVMEGNLKRIIDSMQPAVPFTPAPSRVSSSVNLSSSALSSSSVSSSSSATVEVSTTPMQKALNEVKRQLKIDDIRKGPGLMASDIKEVADLYGVNYVELMVFLTPAASPSKTASSVSPSSLTVASSSSLAVAPAADKTPSEKMKLALAEVKANRERDMGVSMGSLDYRQIALKHGVDYEHLVHFVRLDL